jgi:hypothetical protein
MKKYYKLINNTPEDKSNYLRKFSEDKHIKLEKKLIGTQYLLIEKTQNKDNTETYTNLYPINNEFELIDIIKNGICYDYTGITMVIWQNSDTLSWKTYKNNLKNS